MEQGEEIAAKKISQKNYDRLRRISNNPKLTFVACGIGTGIVFVPRNFDILSLADRGLETEVWLGAKWTVSQFDSS